MLGFPGLSIASDGTAYLDPGGLELTITALPALDVRLLISPTAKEELPEKASGQLRATVAAEIVLLSYMPIVDFGVPDEVFRHAWRCLKKDLDGVFDRGSSMASACQNKR